MKENAVAYMGPCVMGYAISCYFAPVSLGTGSRTLLLSVRGAGTVVKPISCFPHGDAIDQTARTVARVSDFFTAQW